MKSTHAIVAGVVAGVALAVAAATWAQPGGGMGYGPGAGMGQGYGHMGGWGPAPAAWDTAAVPAPAWGRAAHGDGARAQAATRPSGPTHGSTP